TAVNQRANGSKKQNKPKTQIILRNLTSTPKYITSYPVYYRSNKNEQNGNGKVQEKQQNRSQKFLYLSRGWLKLLGLP
ncbi:hypothetical protein, partial [Pseudovibrio sp. SPO723]|uniref:hypothetical protein n=1 Tax=Nesiotobacter zosterae TaxID=392721 RepID=UPI0029C10F0A